MTKADKAAFPDATRRNPEKPGVSRNWTENKLKAGTDTTFDDEQFAGMDPDSCIAAEYGRKAFMEKPEPVDDLLRTGKFVTYSDVLEWH